MPQIKFMSQLLMYTFKIYFQVSVPHTKPQTFSQSCIILNWWHHIIPFTTASNYAVVFLCSGRRSKFKRVNTISSAGQRHRPGVKRFNLSSCPVCISRRCPDIWTLSSFGQSNFFFRTCQQWSVIMLTDLIVKLHNLKLCMFWWQTSQLPSGQTGHFAVFALPTFR